MNRVKFLRSLIQQHRTMGLSPAELHMNSTTADDFSREVGETTADTRSIVNRMRHTRPAVKRLEEFEGVRLIANDKIEGTLIIVRPLQAMGDPDWLASIHRSHPDGTQAQRAMLGSQSAHAFEQKRADSEPADVQKPDTILSQLTENSGINPSTVLIKAMENLDKVQDVIVLRFYKGGSIDMASTMNRFGVIGALQASLGYVANNGE